MANRLPPASKMISPLLRSVLFAAGGLDIILGLLFLLGPETGLNLWPSAVPQLLSRMIGAIVIASGVGVLVGAWRISWEGLRALFYVGLVYGLLTLVSLLYHLLFKAAPLIFWLYTALDLLYLAPIAWVLWSYERN